MNFSNIISVISIRENKTEQELEEHAWSQTDDNVFPYMVMDIKKTSQNKFKFYVCYVDVKTGKKIFEWQKKLKTNSQQVILRMFLKFYQNLKTFSHENVDFSDKRIKLLREYLSNKCIDFDWFKNQLNTKVQEINIDNDQQSDSLRKKKIVKLKAQDQIQVLFKKKFLFIRQQVLIRIKDIQLLIKGKKRISQNQLFHYFDHISLHNQYLFKKEFSTPN